MSSRFSIDSPSVRSEWEGRAVIYVEQGELEGSKQRECVTIALCNLKLGLPAHSTPGPSHLHIVPAEHNENYNDRGLLCGQEQSFPAVHRGEPGKR